MEVREEQESNAPELIVSKDVGEVTDVQEKKDCTPIFVTTEVGMFNEVREVHALNLLVCGSWVLLQIWLPMRSVATPLLYARKPHAI